MDNKSESATKPATAITSAQSPPMVLSSSARSEVSEPGFVTDINLAWPRSAQWIALGLVILAGILLLINAIELLPGKTRPAELALNAVPDYRTDLNRATEAELLQLPGVGPKTAESIVDYRKIHGPFRSVKDLDNVDGIGNAIVERLEDWVFVDEVPRIPANHPDVNAAGLKKQARDGKTPPKINQINRLININTATRSELQTLPRIGPTLSQRIIDSRPFLSVDDLRRVRGIGEKTLERLRPHITVK